MKERIEQLRDALNRHNYKYYVENAPEISDRQFDALMHELQELESRHPEFADQNSPTRRVGSDLLSEFVQAEHRYPMLSLMNTYSIGEVQDFYNRVAAEAEKQEVELACEPKFDGTAISLTYVDGRLERAVTRGDGQKGDDVTANVRTIRTVPLTLHGGGYPAWFEIRGEIFMPHSSFERLNAEREERGEQLFANPRNAAAGTLKLQDSSVVASRRLDSFLYSLESDALPHPTHWENLAEARRWGFKISEDMELCRNMAQVEAYIDRLDRLRHTLPYDTDGVVIKVNDL
ncbi:MAG: NAD-dependent DNA ligase LigA, partial [Rikenellaceae bacterium]|nr:NAD-dependent DNA ligase LigA [Rikenellaceae bacterium]